MNYTTELYTFESQDSVIEETLQKVIKSKEISSDATPSNQCTVCGLVNFNAWALTMHMRRHNNERPSKCTFCTSSFVNNSELKTHIATKHTGEKRHKCRFCPESFSNNSSRYLHEDKHGILQHKCKYCEEKFKTQIQRRVHQKTHCKEELTCKHCPKKFANEIFLKIHEKNDHGRVLSTLKCFRCKIKFNTKEELNSHKDLHKTMAPYARPRQPRINLKSNEVSYFQDSDIKLSSYFFTCGVCSETFSFHIDMTKHIELNHPMEKDAIYKFKCDSCTKSFDSQVKLRSHKIGHGPKKHKCKICDYRTARIKDLTRHVEARHSIQKVYKCSECSESFAQYYNFVNHKLRHGEKKFKCTHCDKAYYVKSRLSKHIRNVHNSGRQVCDQCGRVYCNMLSLKVHKNYMHKSPPLCLCNNCGKSILVNEVQIHQTQCANTNKSLTNKKLKGTHKKLKGPHCLECNITFSVPRYLLEHCKEYHPQNIFPCKACQNEYLSLESSEKHFSRMHGTKQKLIPDKKLNVFTTEEKRSLRSVCSSQSSVILDNCYECFACGTTFQFENELDVHLLLELCSSPKSIIKNFKCKNLNMINYFKITKVHDKYNKATDIYDIKVLPKSTFSEILSICNVEKLKFIEDSSIKLEIKKELLNTDCLLDDINKIIHENAKDMEVLIKHKEPKNISKTVSIKPRQVPVAVKLEQVPIRPREVKNKQKDQQIIRNKMTTSNLLQDEVFKAINTENNISHQNMTPIDMNNGVISPKILMNLLQEKVVNLHGQSFLPLNEVMDHLKQITGISLDSHL